MDIAEFDCKNYLVVKDYFSKWLECVPLNQGKSAKDIIRSLDIIFSYHGYPVVVIADNMPFNSDEFVKYAKACDFELNFSSPTYSQSNGMAESGVKIAKKLLKKSKEEGSSLCTALLEYRNTPLPAIDYSPAQLLFSRRLRTKIPATIKMLKPAIARESGVRLRGKQAKQKEQYDKGAKPLPVLSEGDLVWVWKINCWEEGKVVDITKYPRSYLVEIGGRILRRNRRDLKIRMPKPKSVNLSNSKNDFHMLNRKPSNTIKSQFSECSSGKPKRAVCLPKHFKDYDM